MRVIPVIGVSLMASMLAGCDSINSLTGYTASMMCSKVFVSGLSPEHILDTDLRPSTQGAVDFVKINIDYEGKSVTSNFFGKTDKAIYRDQLGCTLVGEVSEEELRQQQLPELALADLIPNAPWPLGTAGTNQVDGVDVQVIDGIANDLFLENESFAVNTSSVLIAYKGQLIYERYAPNYNADTAVSMFSSSKTVASILAGILQDQGKLNVQQPTELAQWSEHGDPRQEITPHHLLTMTSGLEFSETYKDSQTDVHALMIADDMPGYAADKPLINEPGSAFHYSTGNTLLLSEVMKERLGDRLDLYYAFTQTELFRKIGINSAVLQADNAGNLAVGVLAFMTPRDMARIGLLLSNSGTWNGEQVVSFEWMNYMAKPVELKTEWPTDYGASVYPNTNIGGNRFWPMLPEDTLTAFGHRGQVIVAVPSLDLVVVRTGNAFDDAGIINKVGSFIAQLPAAFSY